MDLGNRGTVTSDGDFGGNVRKKTGERDCLQESTMEMFVKQSKDDRAVCRLVGLNLILEPRF